MSPLFAVGGGDIVKEILCPSSVSKKTDADTAWHILS